MVKEVAKIEKKLATREQINFADKFYFASEFLSFILHISEELSRL